MCTLGLEHNRDITNKRLSAHCLSSVRLVSQKREIAFKKVGVHCHIDVYGFPTTATSSTNLRHSLKAFKLSLALLYAVISTSVPSWKQQRRRRAGFSQLAMTSLRVTMISMVFNLKVFKSCSRGAHSKKHKQQEKNVASHTEQYKHLTVSQKGT